MATRLGFLHSSSSKVKKEQKIDEIENIPVSLDIIIALCLSLNQILRKKRINNLMRQTQASLF